MPSSRLQKEVRPGSKQLSVKARKLVIQDSLPLKVFLVEYDSIGDHFLDITRFYYPQNNVKIHVFFNKSRKFEHNISRLMDQLKPMVVMHESLTESADAAWTDLVAYLINFYTKRMVSCHHCSHNQPQPVCKVFLICAKQDRYVELGALLKSSKTQISIVEGWKCTLIDMFRHVCNGCKLIFPNQAEADIHDRREHNYLCSNPVCERSRRDNGFFTLEEYEHHEANKRVCKFCQTNIFCDSVKYTAHMQSYHVLCNCSCNQYYNTTEDYIKHYCTKFPLPCLEDVTCDSRFRNIDEQAFHHKSVHSSSHPYFCMACYKDSKLVCLRTADELMAHVSLARHNKVDFDFQIIPPEQSSRTPR